MAHLIPTDLSSLPLTDGERALTNALRAILDDSWTIYVQPYLNGMRPDIVIFSEKAGIGVFEVKDWNLAAYAIELNQTLTFNSSRQNTEISSPSERFWKESGLQPSPLAPLPQGEGKNTKTGMKSLLSSDVPETLSGRGTLNATFKPLTPQKEGLTDENRNAELHFPPRPEGEAWGVRVDYTWRARDMATGEMKTVECPLRQVNRYKHAIYKYEIPVLDSRAALDKSIYGLVTTFVYFHKHLTAEAHEKLAPILGAYDTVFGYDDLSRLREILAARGLRKRPKLAAWMAENGIGERVRGVFAQPEHGKTAIQNLLVKFTARQRDLLPNTPGRRRVLGVAGSGKTIIVAHKAAAAAREGKNVLVVCYNITMANYLKDLTRRLARHYGGIEAYQRIQVGHYHRWFGDENIPSPPTPPHPRQGEGGHRRAPASETLTPNPSASASGRGEGEMLDDETAPAPAIGDVNRAHRDAPLHETDIANHGNGGWREIVQPVDVLLVDEGQDFEREWIENLLNVCQPGHFMFMEDDRQDIYGRVEQRGRALPGVSGRPYLLNESFRIPREIARLGDDYAAWAQMGDESGAISTEKPDLTNGLFAWNFWYNGERERCLRAIRDDLADLIATGELRAPADTAVLVCSVADGWAVCEVLESLNLPVQANFESRAEFEALRQLYEGGDFLRAQREMRRGYKAAFWMQGGRVKVCTIHSFKGWELGRILVLFNPVYEAGKHNLLYTAMTRSQGYLTVYNCDPDVNRFGQVAIQRGLMKARFEKARG